MTVKWDEDDEENDGYDDEDIEGTNESQDEPPSASTSTPSFKKLLSLAKPESKMLLFAFTLMVGAEAASLYNPILLADAYNVLVDLSLDESVRMTEINQTMMWVLIIHFSGIFASFLRGSIMSIAGERIVARLRNDLYSCILRQEIAFFDQHKTGELVSRLGSDTTLIQTGTSVAVPEVVLGVVKQLVAVGFMFWISPALAGISVGTIAIMFVVCIPFGNLIGALSKSYQDALGEAQTRSTEALGAIRTVHSFAAEDQEHARYREKVGNPDDFPYWYPFGHKKTKTTYSVGFFQSIVNIGFHTFVFGVGLGAMYVSLWYGFKLVTTGEITLGELTAFQSFIYQIGTGLGTTSRFMATVMQAKGASGRVFDLLERVPAIPCKWFDLGSHKDEDDCSPVPPLNPNLMRGTVEFKNVSFSYKSRPDFPVLLNFSLKIPYKTTAALVGMSGAGKSTVVALLQRFYDVKSGFITIDGNDIRMLDLKWMRSQTGFVQQEPQLFGLTVKENICFGVDREVTERELHQVCKEANAHDFIMSWPKQYETLVGERGIKLSGGQKQRIAIARALLVNPKLLLLDEATSALDAESEHLVQEAIDKAVVGRTVLIVAHRLSTIKKADQIVVLDNHKILDVGTHDVLLRRCPKYQDLIKRQSIIRFDV